MFKKVDVVAVGSPLHPAIFHAFLVYFEKNNLQKFFSGRRSHYNWGYINGISFNLPEHLEVFQNYLNYLTTEN